MNVYCIDYKAELDDVANGVTLRADVHAALDRSVFVFFPSASSQGQYIAYAIGLELDYAHTLHRRLAKVHERVSAEFLYARFAYNIISLLTPPCARFAFPIPAALETAEIDRRRCAHSGTVQEDQDSEGALSSSCIRSWYFAETFFPGYSTDTSSSTSTDTSMEE